MSMIKRKNHYFSWKYKLVRFFKKYDKMMMTECTDFGDPIYYESQDYKTEGEFRYLDLTIPYSNLSEPKTLADLLLFRMRFLIEFDRIELKNEHVLMCAEYMGKSKQEIKAYIQANFRKE